MSHERERLCAYLDGELRPAERVEVEAHLSSCAGCARVLAELASVDAAAASLEASAPDGYFDSFPARVSARLGPRPGARPRRPPAWAWAAAAGIALAVLTPLTLRRAGRDAAGPGAAAPPPRAATAAPSPGSGLAAERAAPAEPPLLQPVRPPAEPRSEAPPSRAQEAVPPRVEAAPPLLEDAASRESKAVVTDSAAAPEALGATPTGSAGLLAKREDRLRAAGASTRADEGERDDERDFRRLESVRAESAEEWRRLAEAWSALASSRPPGTGADEARVRAVEASREAWRASGDAEDETRFRAAARAYLERSDARQAERVRRLLAAPGVP